MKVAIPTWTANYRQTPAQDVPPAAEEARVFADAVVRRLRTIGYTGEVAVGGRRTFQQGNTITLGSNVAERDWPVAAQHEFIHWVLKHQDGTPAENYRMEYEADFGSGVIAGIMGDPPEPLVRAYSKTERDEVHGPGNERAQRAMLGYEFGKRVRSAVEVQLEQCRLANARCPAP